MNSWSPIFTFIVLTVEPIGCEDVNSVFAFIWYFSWKMLESHGSHLQGIKGLLLVLVQPLRWYIRLLDQHNNTARIQQIHCDTFTQGNKLHNTWNLAIKSNRCSLCIMWTFGYIWKCMIIVCRFISFLPSFLPSCPSFLLSFLLSFILSYPSFLPSYPSFLLSSCFQLHFSEIQSY